MSATPALQRLSLESGPRAGPSLTVLVASRHDAAQQAAELILHARGGSMVVAGRLHDVSTLLTPEGGPIVICTTFADADVASLIDLAAFTATATPERPVGFVAGSSSDELLAVARRLTQTRPSAGSRQVLALSEDLPIDLRGARFDTLAFANAEARLTAECDLLYLIGHGNAMHMTAGGTVLCQRAPAAADELGVYPCFHGDDCHFGANRGEVQLSLDRLRARRIVSVGCYAAGFLDQPFAYQHSVAAALARNPILESMIATLRAATITPADVSLLYYLCNRGLPMGAIANRVNRFRLSLGLAAEFLCFGDPETSIGATIEPVQIEQHDDEWIINAPATRGTARDLMAALPVQCLPRDPILLDSTAGDLHNGMLDPDGQLYVTIPADWKGAPIRLRAAARESMIDRGGAAAKLMNDLQFLELYVNLIEESNGTSEELSSTLQAKLHLQELLRTWPLSDYPLHTLVRQRAVEELWRELRCRVDTLGDRFLHLYKALMSRDQRTHPTPWESRFSTEESLPRSVECGYCGHPIDEFRMRARFGTHERWWGLCRPCCAYVYDGDPHVGRWLETPPLFVAGQPASIGFRITNPYGIALDAHVLAVIKHFDRNKSAFSTATRITLQPKEQRLVETALVTIPTTYRSGMYHAAGVTMIGGQINFYRTHVAVRGMPVLDAVGKPNRHSF